MTELCRNVMLQSLLCLSLCSVVVYAAELKIPAHTAYFDPDTGGARMAPDAGGIEWKDLNTSLLWYGQLKNVGAINVAVQLSVPEECRAKISLTVTRVTKSEQHSEHPQDLYGGTHRSVQLDGVVVVDKRIDFGEVPIAESGYYVFRLGAGFEESEKPLQVSALLVDGPPAEDAHFNMKPRRNAASVHLSYPIERGTNVSAFYCEMTGLEDPLWSYYMACGWHRGYFGMQVNSPTERRIIFSVWDSGGEAVDRRKVADENRVQLIDKGDGVYSGDFGNEGTGGHSHLKYWWKTGDKQKFLVTAEPVSDTHTIYAGYYFHPDSKKWMLISSWKAPQEGSYMRGLYSFSENFIGRNGNVVRKALYGNQWIRTADGEWKEITTAKFSHDSTGKEDRLDRFMGVEKGQFFLSHGGFVEGFTEFGVPFDRPSTGMSPAGIVLPQLPAGK